MEINSFWGLIGTPLIAALLQAAKPFVNDKRFYPLMAIGMGVALNLGVALNQGYDPFLGVLLGIVVGLGASGLYSSVKAGIGK